MKNHHKSYAQTFIVYLRIIFQITKLNGFSFPTDQSVTKLSLDSMLLIYVTELVYFEKVSYFVSFIGIT